MDKVYDRWYKVKNVTDTVWYISDSDFAILYLLVGVEKALLIDTGFGAGNLPELCRSLTSLPVEVVLTHAHPDHVMGAGQFDKVMIGDAEIPLLRYLFSADSRKDISSDFFRSPKFKALPKEHTDSWFKQSPKTIIPLSDGDKIDLGERCIRVISTPGHTSGSICLLDEKERLLFSGDTILKCNHLLNLEESAPIEAFQDSLLRIKTFDECFQTILTGHERSFLPKTHLEELINGVNDIVNGKMKGVYHKTVVGPGIKYRFGNGNSVICRI